MIIGGHWHPDAENINAPLMLKAMNVFPTVQGFRPVKAPVAVSDALADVCRGAVTVLESDGDGASYAGTAAGLYKLSNTFTWDDVTRISGGSYTTANGERWQFATFGDLVIGTNYTDDMQKASIAGGGAFQALGGSPPQCRYLGVLRDFLVMGCINGNENRVQWSAINNAEGHTVGTNLADYQDFPQGGPVQGVVGGEVAYVFQRRHVYRMIYVPGSEQIMQFDEVEGGRGISAPFSLVRLGQEAFFFSSDGFYRMSLSSGQAVPIGVGKWNRYFLDDMKAGSELFLLGSISPKNSVILWAYVSKDSNSTSIPNKVVVYDWSIDEAALIEADVEALSEWLSSGVTLDNMNSYGTMETLAFSLDSPFWKGGAPLVGIIGSDHKLAHLEGANMQAQFVTADAEREDRRTLIKGIRPKIDTSDLTIEVAMREADSDTITYGPAETMEDTGYVSAWESGNIGRARITVNAGATWTYAKGLTTKAVDAGER